jgi:hypothetical protein
LSIDRDHHFTMRKISTLLALYSDILLQFTYPFEVIGGIGGRNYGKNILGESVLELAYPNYNPQTNQYDMALIYFSRTLYDRSLLTYIYFTPNSKL